jgi:hypothetical protein
MTTPTADPFIRREPQLVGQTVVVLGGSAGIGLETARAARAGGRRGPYYAPLQEMDFDEARADVSGTCCCRFRSRSTPRARCGPAGR